MTLVIGRLIGPLDQRFPLTARTDLSAERLLLDHIREAMGTNALTTMPRACTAILRLSCLDGAIQSLNEEQMVGTFRYGM